MNFFANLILLFIVSLNLSLAYAEEAKLCKFSMTEVSEELAFSKMRLTTVPTETSGGYCDRYYIRLALDCKNLAQSNGYNCYQLGHEKIISTVTGNYGAVLEYYNLCYACLTQ